MNFFDPSFQNCVKRVTRRPNTFSLFTGYESFTPRMSSHMNVFMGTRLARAHAFFYVVVGVNILNKMSVSPEAPFPLAQADDSDVDNLATRIEEMLWDHEKVHGLLFDYPQHYSYAQAWSLATAMVRSYQARYGVLSDQQSKPVQEEAS